MFAAALQSLAAITNAQDNEMTTAVVPTEDGRGVAACVSVSFGDLRELPVKTVQCLWSLVVCVTQPIHPYHYIRDEQGKVVTDSDGGNKKVWLPFYRLWGEHQGDSVVGIVYDNRGTNGIAGSCWFAGYGNSGWQDKGGKLIGLALLAWSTSEGLGSKHAEHESSSRKIEPEPVVSTSHSHEEPREPPTQPLPTSTPQPQAEQTPPPALPAGWEGEGGPVGR